MNEWIVVAVILLAIALTEFGWIWYLHERLDKMHQKLYDMQEHYRRRSVGDDSNR